jgi:hypothetical protein
LDEEEMKETDLEQYKIISTSFNDEVTRFWSRFNILMGIQMGGFIGILASLKMLVSNPSLFRLALILMTLYSIATTLIVIRGHLMHETILRMLAMMEEDSEGELHILQFARKASRVPVGLNQLVGIGMSGVFSVAWICFLVLAEAKKYGFSILK